MMEVYQFYLTPEEVEKINKGDQTLLLAWQATKHGDVAGIRANIEKYRRVARITNCDSLEKAYREMNLWEGSANVVLSVLNPASMSVGDLIVWNGQTYWCAPVGFELIDITF